MNHDRMQPGPSTMPFEDLERAYEGLAVAIDAAGPDQESLFLTRLALVLAHRSGSLAEFEAAVAAALEAVPSSSPG